MRKSIKVGLVIVKKKIKIISQHNYEFKVDTKLNEDVYNDFKGYNIINNSSEIILPNNFLDPTKAVQDVWRYIIKLNDKKCSKSNAPFNLIPYTISRNYRQDNNPNSVIIEKPDITSIVLILESPHKDEYDCNFNRIGPAQGSTGSAIDVNIETLLNELANKHNINLDKKEYKFIICEPIPYQCSLHEIYKDYYSGIDNTIRNKVWKKLWEIKDGNKNLLLQNNFRKRILSYSPDLIINACTSNLKGFVTELLYKPEFNKIPNIVKTHHPASNWNKHNNSINSLTKKQLEAKFGIIVIR